MSVLKRFRPGPFVSINDSMRLVVFCQSQEERDGYVNKLAGKVRSDENMMMVEDNLVCTGYL